MDNQGNTNISEKLNEEIDKLKVKDYTSYQNFYDMTVQYLYNVIWNIIGEQNATNEVVDELYNDIYLSIATELTDNSQFYTWAGGKAETISNTYITTHNIVKNDKEKDEGAVAATIAAGEIGIADSSGTAAVAGGTNGVEKLGLGISSSGASGTFAGAGSTAGAVASAAAKVGLSLGVKIAIGIAAATVVIGGSIGVYAFVNNDKKDKTPENTVTEAAAGDAGEVSETTTEEVKTEEENVELSTTDKYVQYVEAELIPVWGMTNLGDYDATVYEQSANNVTQEKVYLDWFSPDEGIITYKTADYDGDGEDELAVIFVEKFFNDKKYMTLAMYDVDDNGEVYEVDNMILGCQYHIPYGNWGNEEGLSDGYGENDELYGEYYNTVNIFEFGDSPSEYMYDISIAQYEGKQALFVSYQYKNKYGDYLNTSLIELTDGKIQNSLNYYVEIENNGEWKSARECVYNGDELVSEADYSYFDNMDHYKGDYKDFKDFYAQYGINVLDINDTNETCLLDLDDENNELLFTTKVYSTDDNELSEGKHYMSEFTDYTGNNTVATASKEREENVFDEGCIYVSYTVGYPIERYVVVNLDNGQSCAMLLDENTKLYFGQGESAAIDSVNMVMLRPNGEISAPEQYSGIDVDKWYSVSELYCYDRDYDLEHEMFGF